MSNSSLLVEACLVDGEWVRPNRAIRVDNPFDGSPVGHVPDAPDELVRRAIAAAHAARNQWARGTAKHRSDILKRFYRLVCKNEAALADILTREQGKPRPEALAEVRYAAAYIEWYGEEARRVEGSLLAANSDDTRILVMRQPVGVVAAITPWNFPAAMVTRKIAPALGAGCTVVLKPAHETPFTALALGKLAQMAGVPNGVLNIVTGDPVRIGAALTASPLVRKLTFTGSTRVGAALYAQSAPSIKKLSLELGGNAPFIVFADADIDGAVAAAMASKFRNAGQTCVCTNRIFVERSIHDTFVERLTRKIAALTVGNGAAEGVTIGPLISDAAAARMERLVADAIGKGGQLVTGGARAGKESRLFQPTLVTGVTPEMLLAQEEIFGPIAGITAFDSEAEVIARANETPYGLAAYVFTGSVARTWRMMEALECGMVGVNTGLLSTEVAPFGGTKLSGLEREGGRLGMEAYLETKYCALEVA